MKTVHLNLLQEAEKLSSSPVRPKILLPVIFGVLFFAVLGWCGFVYLQSGLIDREAAALRAEAAALEKPFAEASGVRQRMLEKEAELAQCRGYLKARRTWGGTLAAIATMIPPGIQLGMVEIPEPPAQNLLPPPGVKAPALLGPTNTLEGVVFRIAGRTDREERLFAFLKAIRETAAFTENLVIAEGEGAAKKGQSPRMRQFRQDAVTDDAGNRAILFDVEYTTPGRNFAP